MLGFHPRGQKGRNHTADNRPHHGAHAWMTTRQGAYELMTKLQASNVLNISPWDKWVLEQQEVEVWHSFAPLFGYTEHISDTEGVLRAAYDPRVEEPCLLNYACNIRPYRIRPEAEDSGMNATGNFGVLG